jgi:hypothetical protein
VIQEVVFHGAVEDYDPHLLVGLDSVYNFLKLPTISGPITLIGGLSIVTRQEAGDRRVTRICAGLVSAFDNPMGFSLAAGFVGAFTTVIVSPYFEAHAISRLTRPARPFRASCMPLVKP